MKKLPPLNFVFGLFAVASGLMALALRCPAATYPLPSENAAVEKAAAATNLRAVALRATDPAVWLGLSSLAQPGEPVRQELSDMAVKAKPEFGSVAMVLVNAMDGVSEESAAELIRRDPDNALGYYLLANRLNTPGNKKEVLEAYRKGAACPEFRLYGNTVSNVLFKALDALNLNGADRLCASSWMASRWQNFEIGNFQSPGPALAALAKDADPATRREISDLMLVAAGHLIGSDLENQVFGRRTLVSAFQLKADIAGSEKSPTMNGYAGVAQALVSTEFKKQNPVDLAIFLPDRIWIASTFTDPNGLKFARDKESRLPEVERPAFEKVKNDAVRAAKALVDAALPDQDEIMGAYFIGRMPPRTNAPAPWATSPTYVERLTARKPDFFKAAAAFEDARGALEGAVYAEPTAAKRTGSTAPDHVITAKVAEDVCLYNLRRIDSAKQQWGLEMGKQASDTPTWADLQPYLARGKNNDLLPKCPSGGAYTIGKLSEKPTCNIPGHQMP